MEQMHHDFNTPQPHGAPLKAVVNAVISTMASAGTTLVSLLSGLLAAVLILYSGYVLYDTPNPGAGQVQPGSAAV